MMNWKEIAKKWPLLYWINAKLKCFYLKRDLARLSSEYQKKVTNYRISYSAGQAVTTFKSRHKLKNPNFRDAYLEFRVFAIKLSECNAGVDQRVRLLLFSAVN